MKSASATCVFAIAPMNSIFVSSTPLSDTRSSPLRTGNNGTENRQYFFTVVLDMDPFTTKWSGEWLCREDWRTGSYIIFSAKGRHISHEYFIIELRKNLIQRPPTLNISGFRLSIASFLWHDVCHLSRDEILIAGHAKPSGHRKKYVDYRRNVSLYVGASNLQDHTHTFCNRRTKTAGRIYSLI